MEAKGASSRALAGGRDGPLQVRTPSACGITMEPRIRWTNSHWRRLEPLDRADYSNNTSGTTTTTSGTSLSTPSTNTPGCFTPQSSDGLDPILDLSWGVSQDREKQLDLIKCDFCVANGDASVLERWLPEMGVSHRHVADDAGDGGSGGIIAANAVVPTPAEKLQPLIGVREAVSRASQDVGLSLCSTSSEEAKRITDEMASLLLAKEAKLDEAIWSIMEETRTRLLASTEEDDPWWSTPTPQGMSHDIDKVTRVTISYINLLSTNCATMHRIVDQAVQLRGYVPKIDNVSPLTSLIMETVSGLEEKLAEKSRSFPDHSSSFLFLINNSYFIWQQLCPTATILESHMSDLTRKIDNYIETYLQVSWAPVLSCLYNSTPLCLGRYSSPVKFESEFQKTYAVQKFWKVPDPKLRRRLRVAVIEKVVSSFTKYLVYNNISRSRITPQDLMDMLQELFEG